MSLYRRIGSKKWVMDFVINGQRIKESTGTSSKTLAADIERARRRDLEAGMWGVRKRKQPRLFSVAADTWLSVKKNSAAAGDLSPKTVLIERINLSHLKPELGRKLICDIDASEITQYKRTRQDHGASPTTVNLELGTLRAIVGPRMWAAIREDAKEAGESIMFKTTNDVGRKLEPHEEKALLQACAQSRSRCLLPFVTLAIETGARYNTIRTLQWANINFANRLLQFGKDKTDAGTGRIVPLNPRAIATLKFWASQFPDRKPEHYVFPFERYGGNGKDDVFGFTGGIAYASDPTEPIHDIKSAWQAAKLRAGKILNGVSEPDQDAAIPESGVQETKDANNKLALCCRFHDLRHTAVSRMLDAGVHLTKVAAIVGWKPSTMVLMAKRYGHFNTDELRSAVEAITRTEIHTDSAFVLRETREENERAN